MRPDIIAGPIFLNLRPKNVSSLKPGSDKTSLQSELDSSSTNKGMILFIIIPLLFT